MSKQTKSEYEFEKFCGLMHIFYRKVHESQQQRPDYEIVLSDQQVLVEVKQFDPNPEEQEVIILQNQGKASAFSIEPGKRLRKAIHEANRQLKSLSKGKIPSLLIVYDNTPHKFHTIDYSVRTAMLGLDEINFYISKKPQEPVTFGETFSGKKGRALRQNANTSISAIAVLQPFWHNVDLVVFHNKFAIQPINPRSLRFANVRQFWLPEITQNSFVDWKMIS